MAYQHLQTTPESCLERLPFRLHSPELWLNGVMRIDNREELATKLSLPQARLQEWPDSAWVREAYLRWGECCVEHLVGSFAFALWDARQQALFCARDPMGTQPLYYRPGSCFLFGSEIKAILAHPNARPEILEEKVMEFFLQSFQDHSITFYKGGFSASFGTCDVGS